MPLQKSFSEQNHSRNNQRRGGQWQRHNSYNSPKFGRDDDDSVKPKPLPGFSVDVFLATKKKLSSFQFEAPKEERKQAQNTADATSKSMGSETHMVHLEDNNDERMSVGKTASRLQQMSQDESAKKKGPGTPSSGRLKLPDLLGMTDVDSPSRVLAKTPEERVSWNNNEPFTQSSDLFTNSRPRKRFKARSSSPVQSQLSSSPVRNPAHFSNDTPGPPVGKLNLKTPMGPGLDLWAGYGATNGLANPLMAQLKTSTPPPPQDNSKRAAITRSVSMGDQVPKKRKIGTQRSSSDMFPDVVRGSVTRHPRVGALLDGIKEKSERWAARSKDIGEPSSSSPAQFRHSTDKEDVTLESSPLKPRSLPPPPKPDKPQVSSRAASPTQGQETVAAASNPPSSQETDYGDDDWDDEMMNAAVDQVYGASQAVPKQPGSSPPKRKAPAAPVQQVRPKPPDPQQPATKSLAPALVKPAPVATPKIADDPAAQPWPAPTAQSVRKPPITFDNGDDDEFGDLSDWDEDTVIDVEEISRHYNNSQAARVNARTASAPMAPHKAVVPKPSCQPVARTVSMPAQSVTPRPPPIQFEQPDEDYGMDSDDDDDFAMITEDVVTPQAAQEVGSANSNYAPPTASQKPRVIQRYLVTSIAEVRFENEKGRQEREKVVSVQVEKIKDTRVIHLRGGWIDTPVTDKAYVHVIGDFINHHIIIDDMHNMIILHPDHLISSTVVADSFECTRRAVLQDRVKATSKSSGPMVYGTMIHEIFQAAMMANRWDTAWLHKTIDYACQQHLEDLYKIKVQIPQAVEHLRSKINELQSWASLFVAATPQPEAKVSFNGEKANMAVTKLLDVEEHVWSPMYGLKGNIDATVQVTMQDKGSNEQRVLTVPFEVKTGKRPNASHRAQTALYNLLLSDRYDIDVVYGILYYTETSETIRIPRVRHELRHMIMQRNSLAVYVRDKSTQLPPMLKKEPLCGRCYAQTECFIYHKMADDGTGETSGMKAKFDAVVKHLTLVHKEFFLRWDDLLTKEEREAMKFKRELWTMLSSEREKLGRCFANVVIEPGSAYEEVNTSGGKINRFKYTLIRDSPNTGSFLESQIVVGEPIVISDEKGHFALANGYATNVRKHRITVAVDRRLHNARTRQRGFDEDNNQVFDSIMDVASGPDLTLPTQLESTQPDSVIYYRLDKDEFSNGLATVRNNLIQIMSDTLFGARKIRELVVDLKPPTFRAQSTQYALRESKGINLDQRNAIEKVMSAQDYALVLGMPGTGKTTTIAHIIRALVSQGKSVLLTSYTHSAVDNILLKLKDDVIPILRLGAATKIHPEIQTFAKMASRPSETFEKLRSTWHDSPIVATTCLGVNHALFSERTFDYCIVDEASQITLPVCLGPIRMAKAFVLVGDHNQLPPLVQNEDARKGGLDISLFKLLSDAAPQAVCVLEHQYRMCADVMELSNSLIYSGRLKCGTQAVANRSLRIPNPGGLMGCHGMSTTTGYPQNGSHNGVKLCPGPHKGCWLADLLDPATKAVFLNTDALLPLSRESAAGNRIVNSLEAAATTQLVRALLAINVPGCEIGVMTHYRSQLALLKDSISGIPGAGSEKEGGVEMHTCDRFQGRDKEVVIISLVRSNESASIGELLKDWRRINVAFTRAKSKLIVIGSGSTLKGRGGASKEMVGKFVRLMESKKWVYDLPIDALESHVFEAVGTQLSVSARIGQSPEKARWKKMGVRRTHASEKKEPRRKGANEETVLKGRPVMRDIMNEARGNS